MVKKIDKNSTRNLKTQSLQTVTEKNSSVSKIEETNLNKITICIDSCQNIQPIYPLSNLIIKCIYKNEEIGKTSFILTNDPIVIINHKFLIKCDVESSLAINELANNPILLKIIQFDAPSDHMSNKTQIKEALIESLGSQIESAICLYEAFTGDVVKEKAQPIGFVPTKPRKKSKIKNKDKKEKKSSKKNENLSNESSKSSTQCLQTDNKNSLKTKSFTETELGTCLIDLIAIALGKTSFSQFVQVNLGQIFTDDRMIRHLAIPGLNVTVSIKKPIEFKCSPQLLSITFESIFNVPFVMNGSKNYDVCIWLPDVELTNKPLILKNGTYTIEAVKAQADVVWSTLKKEYFNVTKNKVNSQITSIRNHVDKVNLEKVLISDKPRIEFNCLKRNVLTKQDFFHLFDYVRTSQRLIIEIQISQKDLDTKYVNGSAGPTVCDYIHLMAIVDLSTILYPGTTKIRSAVPLRTFNQKEAFEMGQLNASYFCPLKEKTDLFIQSESKQNPTESKKKTKNTKNSKMSQLSSNTEINTLPVEPLESVDPTSLQIFNEDGDPTFIILQFELSHPFVEKKDSTAIHNHCFPNILHKSSEEQILILDTREKATYDYRIIENIIKDINKHFASYIIKKSLCHCESRGDFLMYLKRTGAYQTFVAQLSNVATAIAQNKLDHISLNRKITEYQSLIEKLFIELSHEVNTVLQTTTPSNILSTKAPKDLANLLFYAKEARENGLKNLANRYYLEMLYHNTKNANFWFNYAIFHLENSDIEKAFVCVQEALSTNKFHKNSLLLNGILLSKMNRKQDAELHFLTVMVQEPHWVEGWMVLYLFYKENDQIGEMNHALEMADKYNKCQYGEGNFQKSEDLAWSSTICPNTIYFKTAILLLKMRIYSWVEKILSHEVKQIGIIHYLLAAICYYKKDFEHALSHLEEAQYFHGSNHNIMCLKGHCHLALAQFNKAEQEYFDALASNDKPERMHLLYINYAKVVKDVQESRKLLLMACKNYPTPYTWTSCGILYFQAHDLLSAEECFANSISLDTEIAENWGYLTLIHLKLNSAEEAKICYSIALKSNLEGELLNEINTGLRKLQQK